MKKIFIILLVIFYSSLSASDTLRVSRAKFFIDLKSILFIPIPSHRTSSFQSSSEEGSGDENFNIHNLTTTNFGASAGVSFRLKKHLSYEISLTYYHYKIATNIIGTNNIYSYMGEYHFNGYQNFTTWWNCAGIGNGLSFKKKNFIFSNTLMFYLFIARNSRMDKHNYIDNSSHSETASNNNFSNYPSTNPFELLTEHKIGYSLFKNKIEPYIGININYGNTMGTPEFLAKGVMPFLSAKINF